MLNKEKYVEDILDIACSGSRMAVRNSTKEVCRCSDFSCSECLFGASEDCIESCKNWCNSEYTPCEGVSVTINILGSPNDIDMTQIEELLINAGYDLLSSDFIEISEDTMENLMKSYVPRIDKKN